MEAQRVVVIQDASREVSLSAIGWVLHGLSLKPGDKLTLLAVIHQVKTPSTLSFMRSKRPLGYGSRVDSSSMLGANERVVETEVARKTNEYQNSIELGQISELYEAKQVEFDIEVTAGSSPKAVALKAAINLKATWVILDRKMKKDREYFLEKLSCGISRIKRNNKIEQLRGPKAKAIDKHSADMIRSSQVMYDEMMPGSPEEDDLFSIELFPNLYIKPL
ncbi:uncharacterized protein LOC132162847 [Corylus avellana]|uniref:uncharacterized protein LOC132162847 n=1 Tax=Corylus avellana TaxID=13451 RepID=UPI00286C86CB|nr:uncharacterized protein LOC132162847 [Corylus avellana]